MLQTGSENTFVQVFMIVFTILGIIATIFGCVFGFISAFYPQRIQILMEHFYTFPTPTPIKINVDEVSNETSIVNPTSTQKPIVIETPAPFYDSFDLRPSEEWEYITGDWRVVDGMFTGTGSTDWISAQLTNPNWTNYTIDTNIFRKTFTEGFCILVRKNPDGHLAFCSHGQFCYWALSKDGNEQQIAYLTGSKFERLKGSFNVTIEVDDDIFTAYINKEKILQVQDTNFSSGRIGIGIDPGNFIIGIEDFRVTPK